MAQGKKQTENVKADEADKDQAEGEEGAEQPGGRPNRLKLAILIAAPLLLLLSGGGAGAYFTGMLDGLLGRGAGEDGADANLAPRDAIYFDLPEMLVNLNSNGRRASYLRVVVSLEVANKDDIARLEQVMPRIVDNFQVFLRELRVEDLRGSAGMYRLKEELLARVNESARPAEVRDVLFREMLVQ